MRTLLSLTAVVSFVIVAAWAGPKMRSTASTPKTAERLAMASDGTGLKTATLAVSGMTCETCPLTVKLSLTKVVGVTDVDVRFDTKQAVVAFEDTKTTVAALVKATTDAGYPSTVKE